MENKERFCEQIKNSVIQREASLTFVFVIKSFLQYLINWVQLERAGEVVELGHVRIPKHYLLCDWLQFFERVSQR